MIKISAVLFLALACPLEALGQEPDPVDAPAAEAPATPEEEAPIAAPAPEPAPAPEAVPASALDPVAVTASTPGGVNEFMKVFTSYQVYLVACVCVAGMTFTKKAVKAFGKEKGSRLLQSPWIGILLTSGNIPMGALFGLVPGFLPGGSFVERIMIGAVAGFMSNTIYGVVKRFIPDTMEATDTVKGIAQRKGLRE